MSMLSDLAPIRTPAVTGRHWVQCLFLVLSAVAVLVSPLTARSETITIAVEDKDWSPYYVWVDGEPQGPCPEIAAGAVRLMDAEVEFVRVPWIRVLQSVERRRVDAGLCGTKSDERLAYSHFPDEPLLNYDATLFVRADSPLQSSDLAGLDGLTVGMVKGYSYGGVDGDLEAAGMVRMETNNRESLLNLLVLGRVDAVLDSLLPTFFDARRLGMEADIRAVLPSLAQTPGYLFFSKKLGHDDLAARFSGALEDFKTTPEYRQIEERYGL
jgi:polar amino acid transport system substrate-binding protein